MTFVQVEMERSYLTAEVFREILQQNGRSNGDGEIIRTLSGRQVQLAWQSYAGDAVHLHACSTVLMG